MKYHRKIKGKNPDKMCQFIFLKIYPQQQKKRLKNYLYIYLECQTIHSNPYLKLHNTHLLHLFVDMYILKFFFFRKHDFARLILSVKKFQGIGTKSLVLSFQNSFSASFSQYLKNNLTKIVH